MSRDEKYMARAMELALNGTGSVSPNPLVGSVIVHNDTIIGEGWHQEFGGPHAEVNAVNSVKDPSLLSESTIYVNLEPCSHHGKTPPCAELLIRKKFREVIIANTDPNPLVGGKGISLLKEAGVKVKTGMLQKDGEYLNRRFFTAQSLKRPYIILKWAETSDGFIARENHDSKWISDDYSRKMVHKWRSEEDAILVGTNTAQHDNPKLNVRDWEGKDPVRIVIDPNLRLPVDLHVFDGSIPTRCYTYEKEEHAENLNYLALNKETFLEDLFRDLILSGIHSVIVEGGAKLINSLIQSELWDEARVFVSEQKFERGISAPEIRLEPQVQSKLQNDQLKTFYRKPSIENPVN